MRSKAALFHNVFPECSAMQSLLGHAVFWGNIGGMEQHQSDQEEAAGSLEG